MYLFLSKALQGTTIKKDGVPFQFHVFLLHELLLLLFAEFVMKETTLLSATLESNIETKSNTQDGTFPHPQHKKKRKED